jgi:tetratricopeptide (TPR) repeat protein
VHRVHWPQVFNNGKSGLAATQEALALFEAAMQLLPSRPEARAALYNAGCCHVKLKQWQQAVDCVEEAVNEQGLKLDVALKVPHRDTLCIPTNSSW